jgi:hypothetical protein
VHELLSELEPAPEREVETMVVHLTEADFEGVYGSKSLSAPDIGDRKLRRVISHVRKELMPARDGKPPREKGVLSFEGEKKELVLNTTNYKLLSAEISRHPGEWVGAEIGLYVTDTSFGGRPEKGIRVKLLKLPEGIASTKAAPATADAEFEEDSIPF